MDAVTIRCGLAGMVTTPFRPTTCRGQPRFVGSTMPRTPRNAISPGDVVAEGVAAGVAVGTGVGVGSAVHAISAATTSTRAA